MNIFMLIDPEWIMHELHRPYVQKGAIWLDEYVGNWSEKIVPDTLDLLSTDVCICGQLFGCYSSRPDFVYEGHDFGFANRLEDIVRLFSEMYNDDTLQSMAFKALDHLWLEEVFWRRCEEVDLLNSAHTLQYNCEH